MRRGDELSRAVNGGRSGGGAGCRPAAVVACGWSRGGRTPAVVAARRASLRVRVPPQCGGTRESRDGGMGFLAFWASFLRGLLELVNVLGLFAAYYVLLIYYEKKILFIC